MEFRKAETEDFESAFGYIQNLWTYNTYDKEEIRTVYERVIRDKNSFAFFVRDEGEDKGFCHGDYIDTFWMSGRTCYISSLITNEKDRGKGYGTALMDYAVQLARRERCKAVILDSGFPRVQAHKFYEKYGMEKTCYGFELAL